MAFYQFFFHSAGTFMDMCKNEPGKVGHALEYAFYIHTIPTIYKPYYPILPDIIFLGPIYLLQETVPVVF